MPRRPINLPYSLEFDGTGHVSVGTLGAYPQNLDNGSFTIMFWIKTTATTTQAIFGTLNSGNTSGIIGQINRNVSDALDSGKIRLFIRDDDNVFNSIATTDDTTVNDGEWHHVALTGKPSTFTFQFYFDGVAVGTSVSTSSVVDNWDFFDFDFTLGARNSAGTVGANFVGNLYNFSMHMVALPEKDILAAYIENSVRQQDLFAEWMMTEGSGTVVRDFIGTNHGMLTGGVTFEEDAPFEPVTRSIAENRFTVRDFGTCVRFNNSSTYVSAFTVSFAGEFTVAVWFNKLDNDFNWILGHGTQNQKLGLFNTNVFWCRVVNAGSSVSANIGYTSALNRSWNCLVARRDSDNLISASLNGGDFVNAGTLSGTFTVTQVGKDEGAAYYNGFVDELALFNTAFTQQQATEFYYGGVVPTTGLQSYYKFDEGSGTVIVDETGRDDGVLNNGTYSSDVKFKPRTAIP